MRRLVIAAGIFGLSVSSGTASADTCSSRASLCRDACTPALVASGEQYGGTVKGCLASCKSRQTSCMKSGTWVHMGSRTRGMEQKVDRR